MSGLRYRSWSASDQGLVRTNNEDSLFSDDTLGLYVVADGVGGAAAGEVASRAVIDGVEGAAAELHRLAKACEPFVEDVQCRRAVFDALETVLGETNRSIFERAQEDESCRGMASTASMLLMAPSGAFVSHVGDSRIYHLRDGDLRQITQDHSWAAELVQAGLLQPENVRQWRFQNVIVRSVGGQDSVEPDFFFIDVQPGDMFLLCSDGLTDYATEDAIRSKLMGPVPEATAGGLLELALQGGGGDNVSVIVVSVGAPAEAVRGIQRITYPQKIKLLRQLEFFQHLEDAEILKVLRYAIEVKIPTGGVVHAQGDPGGELHIVTEGAVDVLVDGSRVATLTAGQYVGQLSLVSGSPHSGTVVASEPTRLFRLRHDDLYDLTQKDQAVAVKILWGFVQHLGDRVIDLSQQLSRRR